MKKLHPIALIIFLLIGLGLLFSFQNNSKNMLNFNSGDYESAWKTIDSLEQQGLPKSALERVLELYEVAKKDENSPQIVKCIIYRGKYESQLEEDGFLKAISKWQLEIENSEFPVKQILQSGLAEMYSNYLSQNRWRIQNRTVTAEWKAEDIGTWTQEQLIEKSAELFWASLEEKNTQKVKLEDFDALLSKGLNSKNLRPTLYDFLAHRAIDYFMNEQAHLTQPSNKFYINDPDFFAPGKDFIKLKLETNDSVSFKFKTLLLFQNLLEFRVTDDNVSALADAELKLWKFVFDNSISETKEADYERILRWASKKYHSDPVASECFYYRAKLDYDRGQNYRPNPDEKGKWDLKNALESCESGIKAHPKSFGASQCLHLKTQILQKNLNVEVEQVNLPNSPFLTQIQYRNVPEIFVRIVRMNEERLAELEQNYRGRDAQKKVTEFLSGLPSVQEYSVELPDDGDFREHSTEIKIDKLPFGKFVILISDNQGFTIESGVFGYAMTNVSNLGFWHRIDHENRNEYIVYDRRYGTPQEGVEAQYFERNYNSFTRKNENQKIGEGKTGKGGFLMPNFSGNGNNYKILLKKGRDTLDLDEWFYIRNAPRKPRSFQTLHFFLDRAIYRPGQTIYFKGILTEKDPEGMPEIVPNQRVTVIFRDANYQDGERLELTTNEYGTVNGTFTAPKSGLLGSMSIYANVNGNRSQKNFRVEEYKRPKFEVGFEPVEGSYKIDSEVNVTGFAKAYAGNNLDGAKVSYRVVREVRFPWIPWWYWRGGYNPWQGESMEITNGITDTDSEGKFKIDFTALGDKSIPTDKKPEFRYTIYADVTDITGETHSNETTLRIGTVALDVTVKNPELASVEQLDSVQIETKNLSGTFEAATGSLKIELLQSPNQIFVERMWETPDKPVIDETIFRKEFPHFPYQNEDEYQNWAVQKLVHAIDFDTEKSKNIDLSYLDFEAGKYALTLTTEDQFGTPVEVKKFFELYDLKDEKPAVPTVGWHLIKKATLEPGNEAEIYFGTSEKSLPILFEIEKDGKIDSRKWVTVNDLKKENLNITETDRGNIHYHFSYAQHNRSFNRNQTISVPWTNKELTIEYGTFRDKLLPGQEEEWIIKIKGLKGEKVAAEMVAGMYDASLDVFASNHWGMNLFPTSYPRRGIQAKGTRLNRWRVFNQNWRQYSQAEVRRYDQFKWFGFLNGGYAAAYGYSDGLLLERSFSISESAAPAALEGAVDLNEVRMSGNADRKMSRKTESVPTEPLAENFDDGRQTSENDTGNKNQDLANIKVRTNLKETVFFYPNLMTDEEGNILIKFTMNEALTKWKFMGLAHTKDLKIGTTTKEIITQKELMVMPTPPRFFRENDLIDFPAKVVNLSDEKLDVRIDFTISNAMTGNLIDLKNQDHGGRIWFTRTLEPGESKSVFAQIKVPDVSDVSLIEHTVTVQAGDFSDGEKSVTPVLSNRMLVTETKPLPVRGNETKTFTLESLKNNNSETLKNHSLTLEFTQNPAWYAVQALPYLMEYPYECTEQIFSRFYANSLATSVANSHPKIKSVFEKWRDLQPEALMSNLSKNEELKSAILEETPWVMAAQSEELQKKNIGLLFDLNRMSYEQEIALAKLTERQLPNGGWSWFPDGRDSWYITQYIVEGMGHLDKLGVKSVTQDDKIWSAVRNAVRYCDNRMVEKYERLEEAVKQGRAKWEDDHLDNLAIHYLYARSFFLEDQSARANVGNDETDRGEKYLNLEGKAQTVFDYYSGQAEQYWLKKGMYQEGMIALSFNRTGKAETAAKLVKSFKERALNHEELGMYWKHASGYFWYQLPMETHSLMIEVFEEVADDSKAVDDLKVWLLKNKQTNHWKTTKATAAAVYALLISGDNWLVEDKPLSIKFPASSNSNLEEQIVQSQKNAEAGTGYFKTKIEGSDIKKSMATVKVKNPNSHPSWGALYWQYFEQLDKIQTFEETPLTLKKQLFKVENSPTGELMKPISENAELTPGDKIHVRIELRVDREMEYVHMKDMRASSFEPINVLSQYKWQGGLGYYESTRDASTNFFFSRLPKGTHVFEYPLRVTYKGDFSNGVTTIQCMYAPEFTSHSEGIRVKVK